MAENGWKPFGVTDARSGVREIMFARRDGDGNWEFGALQLPTPCIETLEPDGVFDDA